MTHPPSSSVMYARLMSKARLRQLQLLVTVTEQGSLKRAAPEVGMSQAAATQAVAELEQLIEQPLFERHAKGMRLTPAGCALMPVVRSVLDALHSSTDTLAALQNQGADDMLRIGAIAAVSPALTSPPMLALCARHPRLLFEVVEDGQAHLLQELLSGSLDLVLCRCVQPLPAKLRYEPLLTDEAWVIAGCGHPLAGRRGLQLADLVECTWMRAARGVWVREVFDEVWARAGLRPRIHPIALAALGPLPEILCDNRTVAMAPLGIARWLCRLDLAVRLDLRFSAPCGEIGVVRHADAADTPLHRELVAALREA